MAYRNFSGGGYGSFSKKQCVIAEDMHHQCLQEMKSENNYLCPDTYTAYKKWCPSDIRAQQGIWRAEKKLSNETWGGISPVK